MANKGTKRGKMDLRWGGGVFGKKGGGGELGIIPLRRDAVVQHYNFINLLYSLLKPTACLTKL